MELLQLSFLEGVVWCYLKCYSPHPLWKHYTFCVFYYIYEMESVPSIKSVFES